MSGHGAGQGAPRGGAAEMRAQLERVRTMAAEAVSANTAARASIEAERQRWAAERRGRDEERARRARDGELGEDLRRLQRRIDAGQTTWDDVLSGADTHRDAVSVRQDMSRNLDGLAARLQVSEVAPDDERAEHAERVRDIHRTRREPPQ